MAPNQVNGMPVLSMEERLQESRQRYSEAITKVLEEEAALYILPADKAQLYQDAAEFTAFLAVVSINAAERADPTKTALIGKWNKLCTEMRRAVPEALLAFGRAAMGGRQA